MRVTKAEREESINSLKEWLKPGDTIWCILRHTARSGMQRSVSAIVLEPDKYQPGQTMDYHISFHVARALGWGYDENNNAVKVSGAGLDVGEHMVQALSRALYGDTFALKRRWL